MPTRDSNNATWFLLQYEADFVPPARGAGPLDGAAPELRGPIGYDTERRVLELLPAPPEVPVRPLSGLAVDLDGQVHRVDRRSGRLLVRRCDGGEVPLVCEPGVLLRPAGLALDRRGYLLVADPAARRVVVVRPDDGGVEAVLAVPGLIEPVDVAATPDGYIVAADRATGRSSGGRIHVFDAHFRPLHAFAPRNGLGLPETPRPVAVMVDADGTLLVADAFHPRLLRFRLDGSPGPDAELTTLARPFLEGGFDLGSPATVFGDRNPRSRIGACPPPTGHRDGGARLAEAHRAVRITRLRLARRFAGAGTYLSRTLDGGRPGTTWHRIELDADIPEGTSIVVETATAEDPAALDSDSTDWHSPRRDGHPIPMTATSPRQHLIQSPPSRALRVRLTLRSGGTETPAVRSVRVLYPRASYLDLMPDVYRRDAEGAAFLERFLALFERVFTGVEDRYEEFSRELNPDAAPTGVIDWLACLVDLAFDPSWSLDRRRALVAEAMDLYRMRGTVRGLQRFVEIYTGSRPAIREAFLERPTRPPWLGGPGSILGCSLTLMGPAPDLPPDEALAQNRAHRFGVLVYLDDPCDADLVLPVVDRIIAVNKPAHTVHTLHAVLPDARVAVQSTVGVDFVLGGRAAPVLRLDEGGASSVLGVDSILGEQRPWSARPTGEAM